MTSKEFWTEANLNARRRKLVNTFVAPFTKRSNPPTFVEWCAAMDELYSKVNQGRENKE